MLVDDDGLVRYLGDVHEIAGTGTAHGMVFMTVYIFWGSTRSRFIGGRNLDTDMEIIFTDLTFRKDDEKRSLREEAGDVPAIVRLEFRCSSYISLLYESDDLRGKSLQIVSNVGDEPT
ncbi:hypothetical protein SISNIDRAFT_467408 [Sistotremastrum niveocremeum HHB9708]|uniref:Uncharacterized protein n=1 Tax=Sistotremastrum niveocremeum HHB9708 TaxID=1314777 RepID=A0A164SUI2_9AGAM|nr:hypothetical protein SISNIDRAFT_467408 [Sistotremastrum niveocremeum HHB9708]